MKARVAYPCMRLDIVGVTQLAECDFSKVDVEGSTPFARFEEHSVRRHRLGLNNWADILAVIDRGLISVLIASRRTRPHIAADSFFDRSDDI